MPGGGGALATVHSGQSQAATGQHVGSALLQPGLTCTGRTETLLSPRARSGGHLPVSTSQLIDMVNTKTIKSG